MSSDSVRDLIMSATRAIDLVPIDRVHWLNDMCDLIKSALRATYSLRPRLLHFLLHVLRQVPAVIRPFCFSSLGDAWGCAQTESLLLWASTLVRWWLLLASAMMLLVYRLFNNRSPMRIGTKRCLRFFARQIYLSPRGWIFSSSLMRILFPMVAVVRTIGFLFVWIAFCASSWLLFAIEKFSATRVSSMDLIESPLPMLTMTTLAVRTQSLKRLR